MLSALLLCFMIIFINYKINQDTAHHPQVENYRDLEGVPWISCRAGCIATLPLAEQASTSRTFKYDR